MNVACTHCQTVFRVDPRKVPEQGVRARCSVCRGVFRVELGQGADPEPALHAAPAVEESATQQEAIAQAPAQVHTSSAPGEPVQVTDGTPSQPPAGAPRFGAQDPHSKARRLARALVSDMVIYHPERQERGMREGSLRKEFKEEIRKSWEEFVEQVGRELAHGTPYFRDALNEILARGQKIF